MRSQLTVRLPDELDREITDAAKRMRLKRSDIVRLALEQYLQDLHLGENLAPYERVQHLVGSVTSGIPDLGTAHRKHLARRMKREA